jgi:hypothetical protein
MGAIDMNMDAIETMLAPNGKLDAAEAQEHADTVSIMLMSFPHMFPAGNQPLESRRRPRSGDRYIRVARGVGEFCGFLSARLDCFETGPGRQQHQAPRRVQRADRAIAGSLQQLPREIYEDQLTKPADLPTCHDLR